MRDLAALATFNAEHGFDKPWFQQYLLWLGHRGGLQVRPRQMQRD
jgi:ABC-type dipeptide/oligopeptide/nickel transport system permease component